MNWIPTGILRHAWAEENDPNLGQALKEPTPWLESWQMHPSRDGRLTQYSNGGPECWGGSQELGLLWIGRWKLLMALASRLLSHQGILSNVNLSNLLLSINTKDNVLRNFAVWNHISENGTSSSCLVGQIWHRETAWITNPGAESQIRGFWTQQSIFILTL